MKPGSMLPESTTTTGDSLPVIHISPFHIMRADVSIKPERDHQKRKNRPPLEHQVVNRNFTILAVH